MILLLVITAHDGRIGDFNTLATKAPNVARIASFQAMDGNTVLLTSTNGKDYIWTPLHGHRLVMPYRALTVREAVRTARQTKRGTVVAMGNEEVYRTLLPMADRVVHLRVLDPNNTTAFSEDLGGFPNLYDASHAASWKVDHLTTHRGGPNGPLYPSFTETVFTSTGIPHFQLEMPAAESRLEEIAT